MAATTKSLNLRIAAYTQPLEAGLAQAERKMATFGRKMAAQGRDLTLSLTTTIGGFGVAAVQAAGDFEQLRNGLVTTMTDAGYSIAQADAELEKLRQAALAPGLDFEQAVKGSLRLQGVGLSAEDARKALAEFGNAIAIAGGSADSLDRVTTQLAQILGKGKLLNEDLMVLKENMPSLSKAMKEAFGSADAETLREAGVTAEQFVAKMTAQLATLPRATGGINNAFTNMQSAIKESMGQIGLEIANAINLKGIMNALAGAISSLASFFTNLSTPMKQALVIFGGYLAILGPLRMVIGGLGSAFSVIAGQLGTLVTAFRTATASTVSFGTAFKAMDLATKATLIGAIATVILSAAAAFGAFNSSAKSTAETLRENVNKSVGEGIAKTKPYIAILTNANSTLEQQKLAIEKLKEVNPQYFGQLTTGKGVVEAATKAQDAYAASLRATAFQQAATGALQELESRRLDVLMAKDEEMLTTGQKLSVALTGYAKKDAYWNELVRKEREKKLKAIDDESAAITAQIVKSVQSTAVTTKETAATTASTAATIKNTDVIAKTTAKRVEAIKEVEEAQQQQNITIVEGVSTLEDYEGKIQQLQQQLKKVVFQSQEFYAIQAQIDALNKTMQFKPPEIPAALPKLQTVGENEQGSEQIAILERMNALRDATILKQQEEAAALAQYMEQFNQMATGQQAFYEMLPGIIGMVGDELAGVFERGELTAEAFGAAMGRIVKKILAGLIQQAVMQVVANTLKNPAFQALGPAAIPIAAAAGTAAAGLFTALANRVSFAEGGIVYGTTLATVGEYPGARTNPEVIAPLSKLQGMLGGMGANMELSGQFEVSGDNLILVLNNAQQKQLRTAGRNG